MKIGDIIELGQYTIETPSPEKGKPVSPIPWRVIDSTDESVLVISEYGLDAKPFHEGSATFPNWRDSSVRKWLNELFLKKAFTEEEQARILLTNVDNSLVQQDHVHPMTCLKNTKDYIFLLSAKEANIYFPTVASARAMPTGYLQWRHEHDSKAYPLDDTNGRCDWLLRSPGPHIYSVMYVSGYGSIDITSANRAHSIRPAMWIKK